MDPSHPVPPSRWCCPQSPHPGRKGFSTEEALPDASAVPAELPCGAGVPRAGGGTLVATQGAGRAVSSPGSRCAGFCVKDSIIYIALIRLSQWPFCWVMLQAVCKSRRLDHTHEITARLWRGEAELCRAVLWGRGGQHASLPAPGGQRCWERGCRQHRDGGRGGTLRVRHILPQPHRDIHHRPAFTACCWLHDPDTQVPPASLHSRLLFPFAFCARRQST